MCGKSYSSQATRTSHPGQSFSQKAPTSLNVTVGSHNQKSSEAVVWRPVLDFSQRGKRRAWCGGKGVPGMWEHPRPNHQGICTGRDYGAQGLRTCSLWPHVPGQGPETGQTVLQTRSLSCSFFHHPHQVLRTFHTLCPGLRCEPRKPVRDFRWRLWPIICHFLSSPALDIWMGRQCLDMQHTAAFGLCMAC